jgi:transcriptional repressor NrdR
MRLPTAGCLVADHCRDRGVAAWVGEMMGELVMEALATLDQVAFIRSASVYRNIREAKDFGEFVGQITADDD